LGGGELGGADGGEEAGERADEQCRGYSAGPGGGGDDDRPVLDGRVAGRGRRAEDDVGDPAEDGEQDGFGEELGADLAFGCAKRAAQPDLGAAFQDGNDHDVGHSDGPDEQGDGAEAEEQAVERAFRGGAGEQGGRRAADADFVGGRGFGGGGQDRLDGADLVGVGPPVDGGGVPVEAEVGPRGGEADQHGGVDFGGERGRVEDAGDGEPATADPDPLSGVDPVDAQASRGVRAEHGDGQLRGGRVEVPAVGVGGGHGGGSRRLAAWTVMPLVLTAGMWGCDRRWRRRRCRSAGPR
jgi:hypothetical protein